MQFFLTVKTIGGPNIVPITILSLHVTRIVIEMMSRRVIFYIGQLPPLMTSVKLNICGLHRPKFPARPVQNVYWSEAAWCRY